jgi:hypothetical protein
MNTVFLARNTYNSTLPWSPKALKLVKKSKKSASLAGFRYYFSKTSDAQKFLDELHLLNK